MYRKISLIFFLAIALAAFLILRPYIFGKKQEPTLEDRLPDADFLGHAKLLNIAKEVSGMLYYYKVPYREFLSEEFILAQAKTYGLQLQNPCFLFANEDESWGGIVELSDSSKVGFGIEKLRHLFELKDTTIANKKVIVFEKAKGYLLYDKDYLMFYQGSKPGKYISRVVNAEVNQISTNWRNFLNEKHYLTKNLAICANWKPLSEATIHQAFAYPLIDSTHVTLYSCLSSKDTLPFSMKPSGVNFSDRSFSNKLANIHLDHTRLKNNPDHPFYKYLVSQGQKIGFPAHHFLQAWAGDLSFSQGGWFTSKEKYIESELDEDFNVTEITKMRDVKVPGFALMYSTNENGAAFFKRLISKGVLTEQENGFYFLLSPPLKIKNTATQHLYYSSYIPPKQTMDSVSHINWTKNGTEFQFYIDSINTFEFYGKLRFPMKHILESKNLTQ